LASAGQPRAEARGWLLEARGKVAQPEVFVPLAPGVPDGLEELEFEPIPGQFGLDVLVEPEEPVLVEPELPELVPELEVPEDPVLVEPELAVVELGAVVLDVAANATVVPTPASIPVSSIPAAICLVRSFTLEQPPIWWSL
jgi:hypothetical protein